MKAVHNLVMALFVTLLLCASGSGQESPAEPKLDTQTAEEFRDRLEKLEQELIRLKLKKGNNNVPKEQQKVLLHLESSHLSQVYDGTPNGNRIFAGKLLFINLTENKITFKPKMHLQLEVNGEKLPVKPLSSKLQSQSFQDGNQTVHLRNIDTEKELNIPAGGTVSTWTVFVELPLNGDIPEMILHAELNNKPVTLNVNRLAADKLDLDLEYIGPRGGLALLTVNGEFDTINTGYLTDLLDEIAAKKVSRVVIRWSPSAAPLDSQIQSWLTSAANTAGSNVQNNNNRNFPSFPATLRELHLAEIPNDNRPSSSDNPSLRGNQNLVPPRIHKSTMEAVNVALKTAFENLPRTELIQEITTGHLYARASALENGAGRLSAEQLPLILQQVESDEPIIQRAALLALGHFGEQAAIDTLKTVAQKNEQTLALAAMQALAASRYPRANQVLLELLENDSVQSKKQIVKILAEYPRKIWADTLMEYARDFNSDLVIDALRALVIIGDPEVPKLLQLALEQDTNTNLRNQAYELLSTRQDPQSEDLIINYTLELLENKPPDGNVINFLNRVKDQRAVPLLIKHFDRNSNNRSQIIQTLGRIGHDSATAFLVSQYPKLQTHEKSHVLNALLEIHSPEFRKLAGEALTTHDSSLVSSACNGLQQDGSPEAVELLTTALKKTTYASGWNYICNALAVIGTVEAQNALKQARDSGNAQKSSYATNALRSLRSRLPGYRYVRTAQHYVRQNKYSEALTQFNLALELTPQLPEAYSGRANVYLKMNKLDEAKKDFAEALRLDPKQSQAVTGLGIILALEGKYKEAIALVEDQRKSFPRDYYYAYNSACVYSRAYEHLQKNKNIPEREKKQSQYKDKAIYELKRSLYYGYSDTEWMKRDPDLKPLENMPEFQEVSDPNNRNKLREEFQKLQQQSTTHTQPPAPHQVQFGGFSGGFSALPAFEE